MTNIRLMKTITRIENWRYVETPYGPQFKNSAWYDDEFFLDELVNDLEMIDGGTCENTHDAETEAGRVVDAYFSSYGLAQPREAVELAAEVFGI